MAKNSQWLDVRVSLSYQPGFDPAHRSPLLRCHTVDRNPRRGMADAQRKLGLWRANVVSLISLGLGLYWIGQKA